MGSGFDRLVPYSLPQDGEIQQSRIYWIIVPQIHRARRYRSPEYVNPPFDPFERTYVDPDRIVRFSGREYPGWENKWDLFGAVLDGDWDVREEIPIDRAYRGTDPDLYLADRYSESVFHQSLKKHFTRDVPWEETALVQETIDRINSNQFDGECWHGCSSISDVWSRCEKVDNLYDSIKKRGCLSYWELNSERGYPETFQQVTKREILVDVARGGELLFVDGRHRLSIANILDLDSIPVLKLVRHKNRVNGTRCALLS